MRFCLCFKYLGLFIVNLHKGWEAGILVKLWRLCEKKARITVVMDIKHVEKVLPYVIIDYMTENGTGVYLRTMFF